MAKTKSRTARWAEAAGNAQEALDALRTAAEPLADALRELQELQEEYQEWLDNLPENLQNSALGEKLQAIVDIDIESYSDDPLTDIESVENAIGEAEGAELPLGFGRD